MNKFQILKAAILSGWQVGRVVYAGLSTITDWEHFTGLNIQHKVGNQADESA